MEMLSKLLTVSEWEPSATKELIIEWWITE
jgi:hypothetical protein